MKTYLTPAERKTFDDRLEFDARDRLLGRCILAIDTGNSLGWCIGQRRNGEIINRSSGVLRLGTSMDGEAWARMYEFLNRTIEYVDPVTIAYEEIRQKQFPAAARIYGGMVAMLEMTATHHGVDLVPCNCASIKKHAVGNGNAQKELLTEAAKEKWPEWEPLSVKMEGDEADARWVLDYYMSEVASS